MKRGRSMKMKKNKKALIALGIMALVGGIGGTLAYFTNSTTLANIFTSKPYSVVITENFVSPDDWKPGDVTNKQVSATNTGEMDMVVRASYTEKWTSANSSNLPLQQDGKTAAIIEFNDDGKWVKDGNYYYYNEVLAPDETTSNFIESVTFNSEITNDLNCVTTQPVQSGPQQVVCTSTGDGYDGATYQLDVTIETVQANAYKDYWGTSVDITGA